MWIIYLFSVRLYGLIISFASVFNNKARQFIKGRRQLFQKLEEHIPTHAKITWFHCASLGEFEQGRPLLEKIKETQPEQFILLTFFSPSGYEIRKNDPLADYVSYLPLDTPGNARHFIRLVQPRQVFFIKYEYWYFFLRELARNNTPVYLISGIFRSGQIFFKWYGSFYRKMLRFFCYLFVQDQSSANLLEGIGIKHYMISGDTRFDRVRQLAESSPERPLINAFCNDHEVIIAGSTWPADEELLCSYINNQPAPHSKFIIAPHEIHPSGIKQLEEMLQVTSIRYSQLSKEISTEQIRVLIIDNIGMLSSLYKYGSIAYIGGGFGKGIHNTLEAATYGLPVLFGPKYKKFLEAVELVAIKAAFPVNNSSEITQTIEALRQDNDKRKTASQSAKGYVQSRSGAIKKITTHI